MELLTAVSWMGIAVLTGKVFINVALGGFQHSRDTVDATSTAMARKTRNTAAIGMAHGER